MKLEEELKLLKKKLRESHIARHKELHKSLDELLADFLGHTGKLPSSASLKEFMAWSYEQTINPTE